MGNVKLRSRPPIFVDNIAILRWWETKWRENPSIPVIEGFSIVKLIELAQGLNLNWLVCYAMFVDATDFFRVPKCREKCNWLALRDEKGELRDFRGPTPGLVGCLEVIAASSKDVEPYSMVSVLYEEMVAFAKGDNPNPKPSPIPEPVPVPQPPPPPAPTPAPAPSPAPETDWKGTVRRFLKAASSVLAVAGVLATFFPAIRPFVAGAKLVVEALLRLVEGYIVQRSYERLAYNLFEVDIPKAYASGEAKARALMYAIKARFPALHLRRGLA